MAKISLVNLVVSICSAAVKENTANVTPQRYSGLSLIYVLFHKKRIESALADMLQRRAIHFQHTWKNLDLKESCNPVLRNLKLPEL